jgi:uncharacterized NAD(P)/FAD-binding protein YdhS
VRGLNMSAFADDPGHFDRWMHEQAQGEVSETDAGSFATRRLYGRYLLALLYQEMALCGGRVRLGADHVVGMKQIPMGGSWIAPAGAPSTPLAWCWRWEPLGETAGFTSLAVTAELNGRP